jgi:hypothetical protein
MPSPIAHSLVGAGAFLALTPETGLKPLSSTLWEKREELLFFIALANLPDLDMVVGLLLHHNAETFHGLFSHSLFGAILMALAASLIYPIGNGRKTFLVAFSLILLHDLMDFSASPNLRDPGPGVSLFFPLSERIASPLPIFLGIQHATIQQLISFHNLRAIGIELLEFGSLVLILYNLKKHFSIRQNVFNKEG